MIFSGETVRTARTRYYQSNGIPLDGGIRDKWARYKFGAASLVAFPNFAHRLDAIKRHDLHHLVVDADTSPLGEGLVAAWELGGGCGKYWISWFMEPQALWWGILLHPRKTFRLFVEGRYSRNFYREPWDERWLDRSVNDLQSFLAPSASRNHGPTFRDLFWFATYAVIGLFFMTLLFPTILIFSPANLGFLRKGS